MRKIISIFILLFFAIQTVQASCATNLPTFINIMIWLQQIGYPLAFFMMAYMGIKWIMAEGPEPRENARRGVIYVVIGIILLRGGVLLTYNLFCW